MAKPEELFPGVGGSGWAVGLPGEQSSFYRRAGLAGLLAAAWARLRPWPQAAVTLETTDRKDQRLRPLTTAEVGALGEQVAAQFLTMRGFRVLWKNFKVRGGGELDLVLRDGQTLVFCEVKTRTSMKRGRPSDAVGPGKQRYISIGAQKWLKMLGSPDIPFRFDVVEVVLIRGGNPKINHIRGAFTLAEPYIYG